MFETQLGNLLTSITPQPIGNITIDSLQDSTQLVLDGTEQVFKFIEIPAGILDVSDLLNVLSMFRVNNDNITTKFYLNNTPDILGSPKQLLIYSQAGSRNTKLFFDFAVYDTTLKGWKSPVLNSVGTYGSIASDEVSIDLDRSVKNYIVHTISGTIGKIVNLTQFEVVRRRKYFN